MSEAARVTPNEWYCLVCRVWFTDEQHDHHRCPRCERPLIGSTWKS